MTLDEMADILSWRTAELDPFRLSLHVQVMRIVFVIGTKALLEGKLGRDATCDRNHAVAIKRLAAKFQAVAESRPAAAQHCTGEPGV